MKNILNLEFEYRFDNDHMFILSNYKICANLARIRVVIGNYTYGKCVEGGVFWRTARIKEKYNP